MSLWQTGDIVGPTNLNAKSGTLPTATVNAAGFARGTSGVTANDNAVAVNAAVAGAPTGTTAIYIPALLQPFNASNVTFNNAIKMVAEPYDGLYFNVRAYGAAGDGVTDDTAAIRSAISAANQATSALQFFTGGVVYFPSGEYICTGTIQMPAAVNQGATTLRGAHERSTTLLFKGATTNFTAAPTTPALVLMGSAAPDNAGTSTNITQFCGIEHLTINGTLLTGTGSVRGVQLTEAQNCWMENVLINNLPNSSTGLYLRGSTITTGLGGTQTRPETRECRFLNVVVDNTVGSGATSTPSGLILQNADENNFYNCVFSVTPGLTGGGQDTIFVVWIQCGRQNRFFGMLIAGDSTANKTNYVAEVFGPPVGENGTPQGTVLQNQTYGDWMEGFDVCLWNRADNTGNTTGNIVLNCNPAIYNTVFKDDNNQFRVGPGGFLSFVVLSPGLGPPDGPINYWGGTRPPYANTIQWISGNTQPDVSGGEFFLTNNASLTTITNFQNPKPGQRWTIFTQDANTVVANNSNISLQGNTNAPLPAGTAVQFYYDGFSTFLRREVGRSTGAGFADGVQALPSVLFNSEQSLGWYRSGASTMALSYGTLAVQQTLSVGTVRAVDGSNNVPAYGFSSEASLGWYRSGTSSVALTPEGRLLVGSPQAFSLATQPEYGFGGETQAGIRRSAASQIGVWIGGSEVVRFHGNGGQGGIWTPAGSATSPSHTFIGEPTLGWYTSAVSVMALSYGGLGVKAGTNASFGTAVLSVGSVKVSTTYVRTGDIIMLSDQGGGANLGSLEVNGITSATSFGILSSNLADTSTVAWWIIRPT